MEPHEQKGTDVFLWVAGLVFGLLVSYLALYFLSVRPSRAGWLVSFTPNGKTIICTPDYHGMPKMIFEPMLELDRAYLRKDMWRFSGRVWNLVPPTSTITNS
jgi:hypothetical protein